MHQELDADGLTHVRGKMSIRLVKRPCSVGRHSSLQGFNESNVPRLFIKDSDCTIVGRLRVFVGIAYRYQVKAIGCPNLATNYGRGAGV